MGTFAKQMDIKELLNNYCLKNQVPKSSNWEESSEQLRNEILEIEQNLNNKYTELVKDIQQRVPEQEFSTLREEINRLYQQNGLSHDREISVERGVEKIENALQNIQKRISYIEEGPNILEIEEKVNIAIESFGNILMETEDKMKETKELTSMLCDQTENLEFKLTENLLVKMRNMVDDGLSNQDERIS